MKFLSSCAAVLAFAASAFAQTADFDPIWTPTNGQEVVAGTTLSITWQAPPKYAGEKISIHLIGGATQGTQEPIMDIAAGVDNSVQKLDWNVPITLGTHNVYGLVFKLESNPAIFQYSNPFNIKPSGVVVSSSTASSAAPSTSTTASGTTTLTTSEGTKTVTLSSSSVQTSSSKPVTTDCTTTAKVITTGYNCTTTTLSTVSKPPVVITTTGAAPTKTSAVVTPPPAVVTAGASRFGAGSVAAVAGLVLAAFAL